jgi:hypothetical protein
VFWSTGWFHSLQSKSLYFPTSYISLLSFASSALLQEFQT